ncbi:hypothetical protein L1887_43988 [Cichorium endivia]|nr:hypothetical protein L1887_43988 [Cichorium endivia]
MLVALCEPEDKVDHHRRQDGRTQNRGPVRVKVNVAALALADLERTDDKDDARALELLLAQLDVALALLPRLAGCAGRRPRCRRCPPRVSGRDEPAGLVHHGAGSFDGKVVSGRLADVNVHLRQPERNQVDAVGQQGGTSVDELGELGHGLYEMARDQIADPLRRLLAQLRLQLDLKDAVGEALDVLGG